MSKLKQKHIQQFLQDIEDFQFGQKEKMQLQQHMTPPDIAARLLFHIYQREPIEEMLVAELGVGTGMLMCGLVFVGAGYVLGVEIDEKYVGVAQGQLEEKVEGGHFDLIRADATNLRLRSKQVDMVVMNPPFGTKQENVDTKFLQMAISICRGPIYSMHKSSTRPFLQRFCLERGYRFEVVMEVEFPLKKRFKGYHKKEVAFTQVDVIRLSPIEEKGEKSMAEKEEKLIQTKENKLTEEEKLIQKKVETPLGE